MPERAALSWDEEVEVAVIGGGPGGSTAAARLAQLGRRVLLVEQQRFPRFHIGESLLPSSAPVLRTLGLHDELDRRFIRKYGARFLDDQLGPGHPDAEARYVFAEAYPPSIPHSWQVPRAEFDELVLRRAEALGADVRERVGEHAARGQKPMRRRVHRQLLEVVLERPPLQRLQLLHGIVTLVRRGRAAYPQADPERPIAKSHHVPATQLFHCAEQRCCALELLGGLALIVGWQAVGVGVSELAAAFGQSLEMGACLEDVAGTIHNKDGIDPHALGRHARRARCEVRCHQLDHFAGADEQHLGLAQILEQLRGQAHRRRGHADRVRADLGGGAHLLGHREAALEHLVQRDAQRTGILGGAHCVFYLAQDLRFTQHHRIQTTGDAERVARGVRVFERVGV